MWTQIRLLLKEHGPHCLLQWHFNWPSKRYRRQYLAAAEYLFVSTPYPASIVCNESVSYNICSIIISSYCRCSHKTGGVYWWLPVWLCPRKRHYRCNLCGLTAAGEIPSSEQEALYGLRGPRESIWSCPSEGYLVGPEKARCWGMWLVQAMYTNARSWVRVGEGFSKEFEVKVGVIQGSVLSPLLFIIVLEALSHEFQAGVPWEDLYADDLVIIAL